MTLSSIGSFALEFRYLSRETGDPKYQNIAHNILTTVKNESGWEPEMDRLLPKYWDAETGKYWKRPSEQGDAEDRNHRCAARFPEHIDNELRETGFGSGGDSFYEYLAKGTVSDPI